MIHLVSHDDEQALKLLIDVVSRRRVLDVIKKMVR
jgi:hypothetical protein